LTDQIFSDLFFENFFFFFLTNPKKYARARKSGQGLVPYSWDLTPSLAIGIAATFPLTGNNMPFFSD